jgi:hypothetical protein
MQRRFVGEETAHRIVAALSHLPDRSFPRSLAICNLSCLQIDTDVLANAIEKTDARFADFSVNHCRMPPLVIQTLVAKMTLNIAAFRSSLQVSPSFFTGCVLSL